MVKISILRLECLKWKKRLVVGNLIFLCYCFETSGHQLVSWDCAQEGLILLKDPVKALELV